MFRSPDQSADYPTAHAQEARRLCVAATPSLRRINENVIEVNLSSKY